MHQIITYDTLKSVARMPVSMPVIMHKTLQFVRKKRERDRRRMLRKRLDPKYREHLRTAKREWFQKRHQDPEFRERRRLARRENGKRCAKSKTAKFHAYKYGAKQRGLAFEITKDEFMRLVSTLCYYCERTPEQVAIGIDRVDNQQGYIAGNCVSCCKSCNFAKGTLGQQEFFNLIEAIAAVAAKDWIARYFDHER
jgi:hypothetical protein